MLPPFTDLRSVQTLVEGDKLELKYGAQDLSPHDAGAYTGEISRRLPRQARLHLRRASATASAASTTRETDEVVNAKVKAAYAPRPHADPLLRRGPRGAQGRAVRSSTSLAQLRRGLDGVTKEQAATIVIAYEPIWAIGTGEVATPEDAQEVCARDPHASSPSSTAATSPTACASSTAASVKADNVAAIMAQEDVDGALVGGASIDPAEFASICRYRDHLATS